MQEIQAIIRQITASITFLPLLSDPCEHDSFCSVHHDDHRFYLPHLLNFACTLAAGTIDLLAYTDKESEVPFEWQA